MVSEAGLAPLPRAAQHPADVQVQGVSFLKFLLSRETDIDVFRESRGKKRQPGHRALSRGQRIGPPKPEAFEHRLAESDFVATAQHAWSNAGQAHHSIVGAGMHYLIDWDVCQQKC